MDAGGRCPVVGGVGGVYQNRSSLKIIFLLPYGKENEYIIVSDHLPLPPPPPSLPISIPGSFQDLRYFIIIGVVVA